MKNSRLELRITEEEKEKATALVKLLGKKNISSLLRDYINDMYSCIDDTTLGFDIDLLIYSYQQELELKTLEKASPMEKMSIRYKLNLLEEIKKERGL